MEYKDSFSPLLNALNKNGAFLTVESGGEVNTMTIGWASIGRIWGQDIMTVLVRYSRYTFDMINKASSFTVSVPEDGALIKELAFCGSKSKRDMDKFKETGLSLVDAKKTQGKIIKQCRYHFECETAYKQAMDPNLTGADFIKKYYKEGSAAHNDYHVFFMGRVLACYETEEE